MWSQMNVVSNRAATSEKFRGGKVFLATIMMSSMCS